MKKIIAFLSLSALLITACNAPKNNNSNHNEHRMEFTVSKIQNEKDGQTIFMEDDKGGRYITIISPANGNFVELNVGDKISLVAETIMESDPAQVISKDIKIIGKEPSFVKIKISTDKKVYKIGEPIMLSFEIKNTGKKPYTFLPWQTPLEKRFTGDCMQVTHSGTAIQYSGIMVKRMPPTEKDYLTLQTNESASEKINLLDGYKLKEKGIYKIQFKESYQGLPASNEIEVEVNL